MVASYCLHVLTYNFVCFTSFKMLSDIFVYVTPLIYPTKGIKCCLPLIGLL